MAQPEYSKVSVERLTEQLEKPLIDDRLYRVIRLPNQLEALLIHDADTDKATAAMDVNVGCFGDDDDMPGMAHAIEHLITKGSQKYPVENEYRSYVTKHSGYSNAATGATSTNYRFEVSATPNSQSESIDASEESSPLYGGLDRFAQFFIAPLFTTSLIDRELYAVDSEYKRNLQNDDRRLRQLERSLTNKSHPMGRFSTGNINSLKIWPEAAGVDVRAKLMNLFEKKYSANRMKLVVLGRESLDTLERWTVDLFSAIPNKNLDQDRWVEIPYGEAELKTQILAKPVKELRKLRLIFPCPNEDDLYETQPSRYIGHLVEHQGPGSIIHYIKAKGWGISIDSGLHSVCPGTKGVFQVEIELTKDGMRNYKEVIKVFFQYVSLLRATPAQEWIFNELKAMADANFNYKQKIRASTFARQTSGVMQRPLPREWILSASKLRRFDQSLIQKTLECLHPENFRILVVTPELEGLDQKEKWYGTEYRYEQIPPAFLNECLAAVTIPSDQRIPELQLPVANPFIPTKLEVNREIENPAPLPVLIRDDDFSRVWWKKDDTFWVPKANVFISLKNPVIKSTAETCIKTKFYAAMVRDALEEISYDADLAGLHYSISSSQEIVICVSGYSEHLHLLLQKVLEIMRTIEIEHDRFEVVKERLTRNLSNWEYQQPSHQANALQQWVIAEKDFLSNELLAEIKNLSVDDIQRFYPLILQQMHVEIFAHGNLGKDEVCNLADLIQSCFESQVLPETQWPINRSLLIPTGYYLHRHTLRDPANLNHCIMYCLQIGNRADRALRAKTLLLHQITREPIFSTLRTKEQLGYIVSSDVCNNTTTIGIRVWIQSERVPEYLEGRIDTFWDQYRERLVNMPTDEFEQHKRSLIDQRLEKMENMTQESNVHWANISSEYYDFELRKEDAAHVELLGKKDIIEFYEHFISPSSAQRSHLSVHLFAQAKRNDSTAIKAPEEYASYERNAEPLIISNVHDFKATMGMTAGPKPVRDLSSFEM